MNSIRGATEIKIFNFNHPGANKNGGSLKMLHQISETSL